MREYSQLGSRIARLLLAFVLVTSAIAVGIGGVSAQQSTDGTDAELVVEQPHYVSNDVEQKRLNGTTLYTASGPQQKIYPQNFDAGDVVNYGVSNGNASLAFDRQTGAFTLKPQGEGTYNLFFVVERQVEKPVQDENGTSNQTATVTEQQRFSASIRVSGQTNLVHQRPGELEEVREDAANWREFNATLKQEGLIGSAGLEPTLQEMINWYDLKKNPQEALTGNVVAYLIIGVSSTAILVWVVVFGAHAKIVRALRRELHIFDAVEEDEGGAKEAIAEMEHRRNQQNSQNQSWHDIKGFDDHIASAFEKVFGPTVHDGGVEFLSAIRPRNLVADRLQAMGHDGYVAVSDDSVRADGGEAGEIPAEVEIVQRADVEHVDEDSVVDLKDAEREEIEGVVDALDWWDHEVIWEFDPREADFDVHEMDVTYESMDLESIGEHVEMDMRHFRNEEAFGEYLREFLETIEASRFCDEDGNPDELRYTLSHFLKLTQLLDDRFNWPAVPTYREHIERALLDFDPEAQAREAVESVQRGGAS